MRAIDVGGLGQNLTVLSSPTTHAINACRSAANMKMFKITIARILTNYPVKVFTVQAPDIISAQMRVWRKVKTWHHVIAAEQSVQADGAKLSPIERDWSGEVEDKAWAYLQKPPRR